MSGITLKNPVVNSIPSAIAASKYGIDTNSKSLSTGRKEDIDVVSNFLGQGLSDKAKILSKVLGNMSYSSDALKVAQNNLDTIASTFSEMLGVIAQVGGSKVATRALDSILQDKMKTAKLQIESAEFDGRKLLTGDLGSDPTVRSKFDSRAVDVRSVTANANFAGDGVYGRSIIRVASNDGVAAGDTIKLGDVTFKIVSATPNIDKNEIQKGLSAAETAQNIATAIKNSQDPSIRAYQVDIVNLNNVSPNVVITQRSSGVGASVGINVSSAAGGITKPDPTTQTLQLIGGAAAVGDKVEIAGVTFTYADAGLAAVGNNQTITRGANAAASMTNLLAAVRTHSVTKGLIDRNLLLVTDASSGGVNVSQRMTIQTVLSKEELNFKATIAAAGGNQVFDGASQTITAGGPALAGDTATINAVQFIYAAGAGGALNADGTLQIGTTAAHAAASLAVAINSNSVLSKDFVASINPTTPAAVILTSKKGATAEATAVVVQAGGGTFALAVAPFAAGPSATVPATQWTASSGGIDVSGIKKLDDFIGPVKPIFTVTDFAVGTAEAANLYRSLGKTPPIGGGTAGDVAVAISANVNGKIFKAVEFQTNGTAGFNQKTVTFTAEDGEFFSVLTAAAGYNPFNALTNGQVAQAQATIGANLTTYLGGAVFAQTKDLSINTSAGDIVVKGASVGSVEGMSVALNSTDFASDKKFEDFKIETGTAAGTVKFTAKIAGLDYVQDNLIPAELIQGRELTLSNAGNGDELYINIGKKGLSSLSSNENYSGVADAIKAALTSSGSGLNVRIGLGFDDTIKVQIPDVGVTKLYRDNAGSFQEKLTVMDDAGTRKAQEVITNALAAIRGAQAVIQGQGETVKAASTSLSSAIGVTKDAADGYLDTDLIQAASAFAAALKSMAAATATYQAGERVAAAGLEIIRTTASGG